MSAKEHPQETQEEKTKTMAMIQVEVMTQAQVITTTMTNTSKLCKAQIRSLFATLLTLLTDHLNNLTDKDHVKQLSDSRQLSFSVITSPKSHSFLVSPR